MAKTTRLAEGLAWLTVASEGASGLHRIEVGHNAMGGFNVACVSDVELADLAIMLANVDGVKEIIAGAVALDRARRPERYG